MITVATQCPEKPLLCQGTTSVVPKPPQKETGFSPCFARPEAAHR
jgi:hypothetical protein